MSTRKMRLSLTFLFCFKLLHAQDSTLCPCDISVDSCDTNCCCDPDCSQAQTEIFQNCGEHRRDPRVCISSIIRNNSNLPTTLSNDGLLCIYHDNYPERSQYLEPDRVEMEDNFLTLKKKYGADSFEPAQEQTLIFDLQVGKPIWMIRSGEFLDRLAIPEPIFSGLCPSEPSVIGLMNEVKSECTRVLPILEASCETTPQLSASFYYEDIYIITNVRVLRGLLSDGTLNLEAALPTIPEEYRIACEASIVKDATELGSNPVWDTDNLVCKNAVTTVNYNLVVKADGTIAGCQLVIGLNELRSERFQQFYSVSFQWEGEKSIDMRRRSGNPGYIVGKPLIGGTRVEMEGKEAISLEIGRGLNVPSGESCSGDLKRKPILFGYQTESGCLLEIGPATNLGQCRNLQAASLRALNSEPRITHIASYANASVENVADWVPILRTTEPNPTSVGSNQPGSCSNLLVGLDIDILFAQTGSALDPQAKIVGAMFSYSSRDIHYECVGVHCQLSELKQKFPVLATVSWTDVSSPAEPALAAIPTFDVRLPHDFFYPFTGSSSKLSLNCSLYLTIAFLFLCF